MDTEVDSIRARILGRHPGAARRDSAERDLGEPPSGDEVRTVIAAIDKTRPLDMDDICVLAYAAEVGDEAASENLAAGLVVPALRALLRALPPVPEAPAGQVVRTMTMGSFSRIGWRAIPEVRRALACVNAVGMIAPAAIVALAGTGDDPAHLTNAYLISEPFPEPLMSAVIAALLRSDDAIDASTAAEIIWAAMRHGEMAAAEARIDALAPASGNGALLAFASIFGRLAVRGLIRRVGMSVDDEGAQKLADRFVNVGFMRMKRAADIRAIPGHADARTVYVLGHLIRLAGLQEQPIAQAVRRELLQRGFQVYLDLFRGTLDMPDDFDDDIYLSYDMVDVLVDILSETGLSVDQFSDRFDALAADRLSRDTRHIAWLRDRRRAIALLIVVARVAERRGDGDLLEAARERAAWLATQPGHELAYEKAQVEEAERVLGCSVPTF